MSTKGFAVACPRDSKELRLRLRTLGYRHCMLRQYCPDRTVLRSINIQLFDRYIDWPFGPRVWGLIVKDLHGRPLSSPTIEHVMAYDYSIRKSVCRKVNKGLDFAAAVAEAQNDSELKSQEFLTQVSISAISFPSRAITAPVYRAMPASSSGGANQPEKREAADDGNGAGKKQRSKGQRQRMKEALQKAKDDAAAANARANGKGHKGAKGGGKDGKAGNGKGGGLPAGHKSHTT